jgi:replicative DNA helicase
MDAEMGPSNWKAVTPSSASQGNGETAFFIQKGSKMNQGQFDEGIDNDQDQPF